MIEPPATKRSGSDFAPIDLKYGFPGKLPTVGRGASNKRLLRFFEEYVRVGSAREAARAAGYSEKWAKETSYKFLKKYADYVTWLQAQVAQQHMQQLAIGQQEVVAAMATIAFANEYDYLVFEKKGAKVGVRRKRLDELTREQMVAIEVVRGSDGKPRDYKFRDRDGKLFELAKCLGLFNEKIILEQRHRHLHTTMDLSKVPMERLEAFEAQFEELLAIGHEEA